MDPVLETAAEFLDRYTLQVQVWFLFAVLPWLVPALFAFAGRKRLRGRGAFVWPLAARLLGYPMFVVLGVAVPLIAFDLFFLPTIVEVHRTAGRWISAVFSILEWNVRWTGSRSGSTSSGRSGSSG